MSASPVSLRTIPHLSPVPTSSGATQPKSARVQTAEDSVAVPSRSAATSLREAARQRTAEHGASTAVTRQAAGSIEPRRKELVQALLAKVPVADRESAKTAIPAILDAACKNGNTDPNQLAYMLATAQTESDFGANMVETGHSKEWYNKNYGSQDGNRPGTDDGYAFRGRGYVQTTRAGRYAEMSHHLGLADVPIVSGGKPVKDSAGKPKMEAALVANPEKLTQPKVAAQALVIGVTHNLFTHNAAAALDKTIPAGKPPGEADFYHARAIVNGIVKAQAQDIASHATAYAHVLAGYRDSIRGVAEAK